MLVYGKLNLLIKSTIPWT